MSYMGNSYGVYGGSALGSVANSNVTVDVHELTAYIDSIVNSKLVEFKKSLKQEYSLEFITNVIRFFQLDYGTGEEILALMYGDDESNIKVALNMLFGSLRDKLKNEIIGEIFK